MCDVPAFLKKSSLSADRQKKKKNQCIVSYQKTMIYTHKIILDCLLLFPHIVSNQHDLV